MAGQWRVIGQRQFEKLTPQNTFESMVEVTFQLASGTIGKIEIPSRLYDADYVSQQVSAKANTMTAIETLEG